MNRQIAIVAIAMVGLLSGTIAQAQRNDDRWVVPKERFTSTVKRMAVFELDVPSRLNGEIRIRQDLTSLITAQLETMGFEVIPVTECEAMWENICNQVGGLNDPVTGETIDERVKAARKHFLNELQARYDVDAIVHSGVIGVPAFIPAGKRAEFCGTAETIHELPNSLKKRPQGPPVAACLLVVVEDVLGVRMYTALHGLQIVVRPEGNQWLEIPSAELFTDPALLQEAVAETIGDLPSRQAD